MTLWINRFNSSISGGNMSLSPIISVTFSVKNTNVSGSSNHNRKTKSDAEVIVQQSNAYMHNQGFLCLGVGLEGFRKNNFDATKSRSRTLLWRSGEIFSLSFGSVRGACYSLWYWPPARVWTSVFGINDWEVKFLGCKSDVASYGLVLQVRHLKARLLAPYSSTFSLCDDVSMR